MGLYSEWPYIFISDMRLLRWTKVKFNVNSICMVSPQISSLYNLPIANKIIYLTPMDRKVKFTTQPLHILYLYYIHTYIIGHYNPSVNIIDPVSHITYVVCVNFVHKWRDLQFKIDSERQTFSEFLPEIC